MMLSLTKLKLDAQLDNRDSLPFVIYELDGKLKSESDKRKIGSYILDKSTNCGDILQIDGCVYSVERVTYVYRYQGKKHVVYLKKLDVTKIKSIYSGEEVLQ